MIMVPIGLLVVTLTSMALCSVRGTAGANPASAKP